MGIKNELEKIGYAIFNGIYSKAEINNLIQEIESSKKLENHFAIRQFCQEIPSVLALVFNEKFSFFFQKHFGLNYFLVKAIYFDKPPNANWLVPWHQDLTIVTDKKKGIAGFTKWTLKNENHYVQPPLEYLNNIITIRIHLDDCKAQNGALKVIPFSHNRGILQKVDYDNEKSVLCEVEKGGLLMMKPLIFHTSKRTENNQNRRVIHLEFSSLELPEGLEWEEKYNFIQKTSF